MVLESPDLSGRREIPLRSTNSKQINGFEFLKKWRRARAVETDGLENRYASNGIEGSNPSASAKKYRPQGRYLFF